VKITGEAPCKKGKVRQCGLFQKVLLGLILLDFFIFGYFMHRNLALKAASQIIINRTVVLQLEPFEWPKKSEQ
jgi:hypothetical protein